MKLITTALLSCQTNCCQEFAASGLEQLDKFVSDGCSHEQHSPLNTRIFRSRSHLLLSSEASRRLRPDWHKCANQVTLWHNLTKEQIAPAI
jgi:hypothetical protein